MKKTKKLFLYSLSSLAVMGTSVAYASQMATAPTLEGGISASIGTWYATSSAENQDYGVIYSSGNATENSEVLEVNPDYDFGFEASLGYVIEDTANSIEVFYRTLDTSATSNAASETWDLYAPALDYYYSSATSSLDYKLNAVDLMLNQFLDIGTHVQMRFAAGISYLDLNKEQTSFYFDEYYAGEDDQQQINSKFTGLGPRLGIDGRYDFGQGFGIVAGGSIAYYLGDLDVSESLTYDVDVPYTYYFDDKIDNHAVTNLRGNVGLDYVYFFDNDEQSTLGLEVGYQVDHYADALGDLASDDYYDAGYSSDFSSLTFSGPYVNLKGVF